MKIFAISQPNVHINKHNKIPLSNKNLSISFGNTDANIKYSRNKIEIRDVLSLKSDLTIDRHQEQPDLKINPVVIKPVSANQTNVYTYSTNMYGQKDEVKVGTIRYNSQKELPKISVTTGKFYPYITVEDKINDKTIQIRLFKNSELQSPDLQIKMKKPQIHFKGNLVVNQLAGYDNTNKVIRDYFINNKFQYVQGGKYKLKNSYSICALTAGEGSRLLPVSEIFNTSKPTTPFPGGQKTLMEQSFLDVAVQTGVVNPLHIKNILSENNNLTVAPNSNYVDKSKDFSLSQIYEHADDLKGDLGPLIDAYRKGIIPQNESVILLPADIFSNADYTKILYDFENSNSGFMLPSYIAERENMQGLPPIKVKEKDTVFKVKDFFDKVQATNTDKDLEILDKAKIKTGEYKDKYMISGSFFVIHSEIIKFLSVLISPEEKAPMFSSNLYKVFKFLNTHDNPHSYLSNEEYQRLKNNGYIDNNDQPVKPRNAQNKKLKMTCCVIKDKNDNLTVSRDIGTVEDYLKTMYDIKNDKLSAGLHPQFVASVKESINDSGIVFMDKQAQETYNKLAQKLNIQTLSGNVIVSEVKD